MRVDQLAPAKGSTKKPKRVGRGIGGKGGKTAGRGTKGQYARNTVKRGFEGGQMPLQRRIPKGGFKNINRVEYAAINLDVLQQLAESNGVTTIDKQFLISKHLINKREMIKVLGRGEITIALEIHAHKFSATAKAAIEKAGGSISEIA